MIHRPVCMSSLTNVSFLYNHRIADTYERFLDNTNDIRQIALRNGFTTNVVEQLNQKTEVISSENDISSTESRDTSNHQPNKCTALKNEHDADQTPTPPLNEQGTIWSGKLNYRNPVANDASTSKMSKLQNEASNSTKSVTVQSTGQQAHSTIHDTLNASLSEHSKASSPDTVAETSCNSIHDETLADLNHIICQAASGGNSLGQNVPNNSEFNQLQKVLESCLANFDIEMSPSSVVNMITNAELDETSKLKLEQGMLTNKFN